MFPSTSGSGLKMPGRFTGTSCWSCGAITMKMISSTSTTSTSGVTFMSGAGPRRETRLCHAKPGPVPPFLDLVLVDLLFRPALDGVEQLAGSGVQRALVARDLRREIVVGEHGRDRDRQPEGGLDERLRDA